MKTLGHIDQHCFACGPLNKNGLKMGFTTDGQKLYSTLTIPEHLRGWSNLAHGGIITTVLDETMGWSAIWLKKRFTLTRTMTVTFKKPVYINSEINITGFIQKEIDDKNLIMEARLLNGDGEVCAIATGEFVLFTAEQFKALDIMSSSEVDIMTEMFDL